MSSEPQLFRINPANRESDRIEEVDFASLGFQERRDIQEWVAANPSILGDDLLIIGKEFSDFDRTNERLDLLAVDFSGRLVIIELKRDDSGADAHWQAVKYASYLQRADADSIIKMAAEYWRESEDDARNRLLQHLGADDLNALNNAQRIILASHRFAPEVTSAALWLNKNAPNAPDLITCIRLTPYQDTQAGSLYVQATTIIPVPGVEGYLVGVGSSTRMERGRGSSSTFGARLAATFTRNRNDEVSEFAQKVGRLAIDGLPDEIRPDRTSRWAGSSQGFDWVGLSGRFRYYHCWYSNGPWSNHKLSYRVHLSEEGAEAGQWSAYVRFVNSEIEMDLGGMKIHPDQFPEWEGKILTVPMGTDTLNDEYAGRIAETLRMFIEQITPVVAELDNETGEVDEPYLPAAVR